MKIVRKEEKTINVGDIISYRGDDCLVVRNRFPNEGSYPFGILDLKTCIIVNSYCSLEALANSNENISLIEKSENITISY